MPKYANLRGVEQKVSMQAREGKRSGQMQVVISGRYRSKYPEF